MRPLILCTLLALAAVSSSHVRAQARGSEASTLSALPVAMSVAAPSVLLAAGAILTVASVEMVADGSVWVLERASDGARATLQLSGRVAGGVSVVAGTAIVATAISAGWVLSAAGQAVAFIPNEVGKALLHNERVTK